MSALPAPRRALSALGLGLGLLALPGMALPGAAHAQADALQAGALILSVSGNAGGTARLERPGREPLRIPLPPRAEVSAFAATANGWLAAGSSLEEDGRRRLFLLAGSAAVPGVRPLPAPPGQQGQERRGPVLLVEDGRLRGLAWLEGDGDRSLAVRAAAWDGEGWQAVESVSAPGPGSQLALSGAVLTDGSWLLAWSAFDGEDDEIVWSRREGAGWTPPRPVDAGNRVPDITPALAAAGGGALLAWSRFDQGSYRLQLARFVEDRWQEQEGSGPAGALFPSFQDLNGRLFLLHLTASPRAWSVVELAPSGRVLRRGSVPSPLSERPVVDTLDGGGLRLRWISGGREASAALERWETRR